MTDHRERKADHLDLCATDQVAFQKKGTLMDQVHLIHEALPELRIADVDLSAQLAGHALTAPVVIAAMTGGLERAAQLGAEFVEQQVILRKGLIERCDVIHIMNDDTISIASEYFDLPIDKVVFSKFKEGSELILWISWKDFIKKDGKIT